MKILNNVRQKVIKNKQTVNDIENLGEGLLRENSSEILTEGLRDDDFNNLYKDFEQYKQNNDEHFAELSANIMDVLSLGGRKYKSTNPEEIEEDAKTEIEKALDSVARYNKGVWSDIDNKNKAFNAWQDAVKKARSEGRDPDTDEEVLKLKRQRLRPVVGEFRSLMLEGMPGVAKTATVKAWCDKHGYELFEKCLYGLDETAISGMPIPDTKTGEIRLYTSEIIRQIYECKKPCVLFLDEYNRGGVEVRNALLGLILNHTAIVRGAEDQLSRSQVLKELAPEALKAESSEEATTIIGEKIVNEGDDLVLGDYTNPMTEKRTTTKGTIIDVDEVEILSNIQVPEITDFEKNKFKTLSTQGVVLRELIMVVGAMNPDDSPEVEVPLAGAETQRFQAREIIEANKNEAQEFIYDLLLNIYGNRTAESINAALKSRGDFTPIEETTTELKQQAIRELLLACHIYTHPDFDFWTHAEYVDFLRVRQTAIDSGNGGSFPVDVPSVRGIQDAILGAEGYKDRFLRTVKKNWTKPIPPDADTNMKKYYQYWGDVFDNILRNYKDPEFRLSREAELEMRDRNTNTTVNVDNVSDLVGFIDDMTGKNADILDEPLEDAEAILAGKGKTGTMKDISALNKEEEKEIPRDYFDM